MNGNTSRTKIVGASSTGEDQGQAGPASENFPPARAVTFYSESSLPKAKPTSLSHGLHPMGHRVVTRIGAMAKAVGLIGVSLSWQMRAALGVCHPPD